MPARSSHAAPKPGDPGSARHRPRLGRAVVVGLFLCASALLVANHKSKHRHPPRSVAEAEERLDEARSRVKAAAQISSLAGHVSMKLEGTNASLTQTVQSFSNSVLQKLEWRAESAGIDLELARMEEAADRCIQTYAREEQAQQAMAALRLAGLKQAIVRGPGQSPTKGEPHYRLMVPHDLAATASATLKHATTCTLKTFVAVADALQAREVLKKRGIGSMLGAVEVMTREGASKRVYHIYVAEEDAGNATEALRAASPPGNASL